MPDRVKVKVQRVVAGNETVKPVAIGELVSGVIPEDGFVVKMDGPHAVPLYVRDSDLEKAKDVWESKGKPFAIDAVSWKGEQDESGT